LLRSIDADITGGKDFYTINCQIEVARQTRSA
jgi:hypothetical protein